MSEDALRKISEKLDQLISLGAINSIKGMKPTEAILVLGSAGLDRNLIAQVTGSTSPTVSVRLSEAKAKAMKKASHKRGSKRTSKQK
jgi:hypothetical protein